MLQQGGSSAFFPTVAKAVMQPSPVSQGDDPAIARLVQYITAQGMLISMLLAEFRAMNNNVV